MSKFYPQYGRNKEGLEKFIRAFSFPGGFPSHVRPPPPCSLACAQSTDLSPFLLRSTPRPLELSTRVESLDTHSRSHTER